MSLLAIFVLAPEIFFQVRCGTKNWCRKLEPSILESVYDASFWHVCHGTNKWEQTVVNKCCQVLHHCQFQEMLLCAGWRRRHQLRTVTAGRNVNVDHWLLAIRLLDMSFSTASWLRPILSSCPTPGLTWSCDYFQLQVH